MSSGRRPDELLQPTRADIAHVFSQQFEGMTIEKVSLDELLDVGERFLKDIQARPDDKAHTFLLSLHDGEPDFEVSAWRMPSPYQPSDGRFSPAKR